MEELHKPVLLSEVLETLQPNPGESYLDLTAGYAGHAGKILAVTRNYKESVLVDRDENAIKVLSEKYPEGEFDIKLLHEDFYNAAQSLIECGKTFDMILADFGVSSPQLDNSERGFSFMHEGALDMRMDQTQDLSAETIVNHWSEKRLIKIFEQYGEESSGLARKHAREIVYNRPWKTTKELAEALSPKGWYGKHPATKVFHSLEDRLVKQYFKEVSSLGRESELEILNKTPIVAGMDELVINPRARSAKLRAARKI